MTHSRECTSESIQKCFVASSSSSSPSFFLRDMIKYELLCQCMYSTHACDVYVIAILLHVYELLCPCMYCAHTCDFYVIAIHLHHLFFLPYSTHMHAFNLNPMFYPSLSFLIALACGMYLGGLCLALLS
jgi:hypothetical protein